MPVTNHRDRHATLGATPLINAIQSLHFRDDRRPELRKIAAGEWPALLDATDRAHMTLALGIRCRDYLPEFVQQRIERNLAGNRERYKYIVREYRTIASALQNRSIDFLTLKGLAQFPSYTDDPRHRPQYDIDIYCPTRTVSAAHKAIAELGYAPAHLAKRHTDHLPTMVRSGWQWRGDYFAADLPLPVELHFRFWDPETEKIPAHRAAHFWTRRSTRIVEGLEVPALHPADGISYSTLHLVRHLLRGDLRIYHVYELAHFLERTALDDSQWNCWHAFGSENAPVLEAIAFRLAREWFGCRAHSVVDDAIDRLPSTVKHWFDLFAFSPMLALESPNKDELLLHLGLVKSAAGRGSILVRRLLPVRPPVQVALPQSRNANPLMSATRLAITRAHHHARTILPLLKSLLRWKLGRVKPASSW